MTEDDPPAERIFITEALCHARHETVYVQIDGLKKAIYLSSAAVGFVIVSVELLLRLVGR